LLFEDKTCPRDVSRGAGTPTETAMIFIARQDEPGSEV
jgi:hypothetical protein